MMHALQLPQLPQSGRFLSIKPMDNPATASRKIGIAINIVVMSSLSGSD
ncbi:MAG: hypothetical protein LJE92_13375 [Gammaproteobacteria bacterium]|jgi:hypothetical protein|nr:hypothetical protein [Gammaproteobacteria bacterium]